MRTQLLLLAALTVFSAQVSRGDHFDPRDSWAYVYEDFTPGSVRTRSGDLILTAKLNVTVTDQSLHYIDGDQILKAEMFRVWSVGIGDDVYLNTGGKLRRVLSESEKGAVLEDLTVDMEKYNRSEIGYGVSSASASTSPLNVIALQSATGGEVSFNAAIKEEGKTSGKILPLQREKYILIFGSYPVKASKTAVMDIPGVDKAAVKAFLKAEKIKWNNVEDLQKVIDFIGE